MLTDGFRFPPWLATAWNTTESKFCERLAKSSYLSGSKECVNDIDHQTQDSLFWLPVLPANYIPHTWAPFVPWNVKRTVFYLVLFPVPSSPLKLPGLNIWNFVLACTYYALITKEIQLKQSRFKKWNSKLCK